MAFRTVFKRYELKYMLTSAQKSKIIAAMEPYMSIDIYGRTTIRNVYYDTANYRLIRRSIEKPVYKEKLRVRSYADADGDSTVFVELKKKYDHIVYKRRMSLREREADEWLNRRNYDGKSSQIFREIDYFLDFYGDLHPMVFLSYEREAFYENGGGDFRVTFDENILARTEDLSLCSGVYGTPMLEEDTVLMELKCSGGIPLWMARVLSENKIYKTAFSKYGNAYSRLIYPKLLKETTDNKKEKLPYECV